MLLPRGTALPVAVVSTVVALGVRSSFSGDFRLDFFEKQHPILTFPRPTDKVVFLTTMFGSSAEENVRKKITCT